MKLSNCLLFLALATIVATTAHSQTLWTGPTTNFSKTADGQADTVLAKSVALTRGGNQVLYNTAAGEMSAASSDSPLGTTWAFGNLINYNTLTYSSLENLRANAGGNFSQYITNKPMVLHLVNSNIYVSLIFTSWEMQGGNFAYTRSTPAAAPPPTPSVSITNPVNGATLVAPANVTIQATASVSSGSVTNVSFFNGASLLGSSTSSPFRFAANNLAAGNYALTAVATAAGVSATSAVVNISVVTPGIITNSAPAISSGNFSFSYSVNSGLTYVVKGSSNLVNWAPLATNVATSGTATFTDTTGLSSRRFYEVILLPNP